MDYGSLLYGPIYDTLGVAATITLADTAGTEIAITAIEKTVGEAIALGGDDLVLQGIKGAAAVRMSDLAAGSVARADMKGSSLTLNGKTWKIHSTLPKPSPMGEFDGELYLMLHEGSA